MINLKFISKIILQEYVDVLNEKRAVDHQITFTEFFNQIYNRYGDRLFLSFRDDNYVTDVNPYNDFNTPTGFYCYPIKSYDDKTANDEYSPHDVRGFNEHRFRSIFPYASDREVMVFVGLNSDLESLNIINEKTPKSKLDDFVNKISQKYGNKPEIQNLCQQWMDNTYRSSYMSHHHDAHKLWLLIYDIGKLLPHSKLQNVFTIICFEIGINGFADLEGRGYIHPAERIQAVLFRVKNIASTYYWEKDSGGEIKIANRLDKLISRNNISDVGKQNILRELRSGYNIPNMFTSYQFRELIAEYPKEIKLFKPEIVRNYLKSETDLIYNLLRDVHKFNYKVADEDNNQEFKEYIELFKPYFDELTSEHIVALISHSGAFKQFFEEEFKSNFNLIVTYIKNKPDSVLKNSPEILNDLLPYMQYDGFDEEKSHQLKKLIYVRPTLLDDKNFIPYLNEKLSDEDIFNVISRRPSAISVFKKRMNKLPISYIFRLCSRDEIYKEYFNKFQKMKIGDVAELLTTPDNGKRIKDFQSRFLEFEFKHLYEIYKRNELTYTKIIEPYLETKIREIVESSEEVENMVFINYVLDDIPTIALKISDIIKKYVNTHTIIKILERDFDYSKEFSDVINNWNEKTLNNDISIRLLESEVFLRELDEITLNKISEKRLNRIFDIDTFEYLIPVIHKIHIGKLNLVVRYLQYNNKLLNFEPRESRNKLIKVFVQKYKDSLNQDIKDEDLDSRDIFDFISRFPFLTRFMKDYLQYVPTQRLKELVDFHPEIKQYVTNIPDVNDDE